MASIPIYTLCIKDYWCVICNFVALVLSSIPTIDKERHLVFCAPLNSWGQLFNLTLMEENVFCRCKEMMTKTMNFVPNNLCLSFCAFIKAKLNFMISTVHHLMHEMPNVIIWSNGELTKDVRICTTIMNETQSFWTKFRFSSHSYNALPNFVLGRLLDFNFSLSVALCKLLPNSFWIARVLIHYVYNVSRILQRTTNTFAHKYSKPFRKIPFSCTIVSSITTLADYSVAL